MSAITYGDPSPPHSPDFDWDYSEPFTHRWKTAYSVGSPLSRCTGPLLSPPALNVTDAACMDSCSDTPSCERYTFHDPVHFDGSPICRSAECLFAGGTCELFGEGECGELGEAVDCTTYEKFGESRFLLRVREPECFPFLVFSKHARGQRVGHCPASFPALLCERGCVAVVLAPHEVDPRSPASELL